MQDSKITKTRIQNHFAYGWWKYLLLAVGAIVGWNLIFTSSAYRAPKDKRLDVTFVTYSLPEELLSSIKEDILARYPEQVEDSSVASIVYTADDNYYGSMQLTTYMGAAEGDIYVLPRERFLAFASSNAFLALDDALASGALDLDGIDVSRGYVKDEEGTTALYGIPTKELYGMWEMGLPADDLVICVMSYSKNPEVAVDWISAWIEKTHTEKPQWLIDYEESQSGGITEISDIPSY